MSHDLVKYLSSLLFHLLGNHYNKFFEWAEVKTKHNTTLLNNNSVTLKTIISGGASIELGWSHDPCEKKNSL